MQKRNDADNGGKDQDCSDRVLDKAMVKEESYRRWVD